MITLAFYGKKNIGDVDSIWLYTKTIRLQPHIYYSLFTDTSAYYLTVHNGGGNPVFTNVNNNTTNHPPAETYFMYPSRQIYTARSQCRGHEYTPDVTDIAYSCLFDLGEGYYDKTYFGTFNNSSSNQLSTVTYSVPTPHVYASGPAVTFKTSYFNNSPNDHHAVNIVVNNSTTVLQQTPCLTANYGCHLNKFSFSLQPSQISQNGNTTVSYSALDCSSAPLVGLQQNVVALNEFDYPHTFDFDGQNTFHFQLDADNGNGKYLFITDFNSGSAPFLFDITNQIYLVGIPAGKPDCL